MKSRLVELSVDVLCKWGPYSPSYRLYVDNNLLTERTYVWNNEEAYIKENIVVNIDPGEHTLTLEKCGEKWIYGEFSLVNLIVDDKPAELVNNKFIVPE